MNVRRDIWSLVQVDVWEPVTLAYAQAVAVMRGRDPEDPTSWRYQAAIHGTDEPPREEWNQCQHASWFFLPWHRMYIYRFEQIVRSIVLEQGGPADWGLPYWNYSKGFPSNTLPPAFREPRLPDGSENALFVAEPGRNPAGINRGARLPERAVETDTPLGEPLFTPLPAPGFGGAVSPPAHFAPRQFTGALENAPHNVVHGLVGGPFETGWMADPNRAAQDPIFWLHHSNIDRVWAKWRAAGGEDPTQPRWLDQTFRLFDEQGQPVTMRVRDVVDPARQRELDYRYDDEGPRRPRRRRMGVAAMSAAGGGRGPARTLAESGPVDLTGEAASVSLPMPPAARSMTATALARGGLSLTVEDVEVDEDTGVVYAVYLGGPDERDDESLAGYVTFFGSSHMQHEGHGGINHAYDVTGVVEHLQETGRWQQGDQQVSFVPVGLEPPPGEVEEPPQPASRARVGRVTLTTVDPEEEEASPPAGGGGVLDPQQASPPAGGAEPDPGQILAWEDDPGQPPSSLQRVSRPVPELGGPRLAIAIAEPQPAAAEPSDSAGLRWWAAAEALARGRDLWTRLLPPEVTWAPSVGPELRVKLDDVEPEFNAYYDRSGLAFFHDTIEGVTCWSGESPDIVCHELGHAVLDAMRPQLWDAAGTEPAAFHEAFGDISALLAALEVPSLREAVLRETGGKPWRSSRVSRVAEQLGWAIRAVSPDRAEPTCLRDASNSWFYRDPATLPPDGPATQLSTEPHFFARIFTGASLKAVAGMFDLLGSRDADALHQAGLDFGALLVDAILAAPVVPSYYSQLAAHMLAADARRFGGRNQEALRFAFVRHGVLALSSAGSVVAAGGAEGIAAGADGPAVAGRDAQGDELPRTMLAATGLGLAGGLVVEACGHTKRFGVAGAAPDTGAVTPPPSDRAAELFVEDLFRQGRIDAGSAASSGVITAPLAYKTHGLQSVDGGFRLQRRVFDCGLHPPGAVG